MRGVFRYLAIVVLLLFVGNEASAQWMKERGWVRKGNRQYAKSNYEQSVVNYENALKYDSLLFEAKYDLASALYRTERYDKAEGILMSLLSDTTRTELERGEVSYNLGNTQFAQKKYKEALASYRYAMRCNPNDEDAKFNYAFTKLKLQDQQQQQQQQENKDNKDNKDQNQDQNQQGQDNKDNKDQQDKQDKEKQDDKQNKDQQNDQNQSQQPQNKEGSDKQQEGQNSESEMKQAQHEAILQAVQAEEDKTQDKLKEKAAVVVVRGKNW